MTHRLNHEAVDPILWDILNSTLPPIGIVLLFIGDFQQIIFVSKTAHQSQVVSAYFRCSRQFLLITLFKLQKILLLKALRTEPHATTNKMEFSSYFVMFGERKCQANNKHSALHLRAVAILICVENILLLVYKDIQQNNREQFWIPQHDFLITKQSYSIFSTL